MKKICMSLLLMSLLLFCSCEENLAEILPEIQVVFLDAGKADCFLIRSESSVVLIDTGKDKTGKKLLDYCAENAIEAIDVMIITHFDKDHVGGADSVLKELAVGKVYEPSYFYDSEDYREYREALAQTKTVAESLLENVSFTLDGISYEIDAANYEAYAEDDKNNFSLVVNMEYGEISFLFTGDAKKQRLEELLREGVGRSTVLKVPYHGRYNDKSQLFLQTVHPQYAVITSGENKREDEEITAILENLGAEIYFTREGTISCTTNGVDISFVQ